MKIRQSYNNTASLMNYFKLISIFTVKLEFSKIYFGKQFVRELLFEFCNVCEQSVLYLFEFA